MGILKTVPDTNVIIAGQKAKNIDSPNKDYFDLFINGEIDLLYSQDTLAEYIEKLYQKNVADDLIDQFLIAIIEIGKNVTIDAFHLIKYPQEFDDFAFLLCAVNGNATHLISYDSDLLDLKTYYSFQICSTLDLLHEFRKVHQ